MELSATLSTSQLPPEETVTFFLDRTHQSKDTARLLRKLGVRIELHKDHFPQDSEDTAWIPICAANGWIILTGDKGIEHSGINRAAVIASAAKVFIISDYRTRGLEQTASLIAARRKMARIAMVNVGPFYCSVEMAKDDHVGKPRFQPGGYAMSVEAVPESALPASGESPISLKQDEKLPSPKTGDLFS